MYTLNKQAWLIIFVRAVYSNKYASPFSNMMYGLQFDKRELVIARPRTCLLVPHKWEISIGSDKLPCSPPWIRYPMAPLMDISHFLQKYLLVAVGEAASPSVDVVMGLVSVMVRVTGRIALGWGEGAKTGVKWPGTFPTTWPLLLGYKTKTERRVKQSKRQSSRPTAPLRARGRVNPADLLGTPQALSSLSHRDQPAGSSKKQQQRFKESLHLQNTVHR